jgi:hypothetical protein
MKDLKLHFNNIEQAQSVLSERFPEWDGITTPYQAESCLVVVSEPISTDEEGEPLPPTWTGVHIDIDQIIEYQGEYDNFVVEVKTPAHKFG